MNKNNYDLLEDNVLKKLKILILAIVLMAVSTIVIIMTGKTYTLKINNFNYASNLEQLNIQIEDENM